ncbi:MAG: 4Fe-4S double cluster binding domain-containing protein [bacterium]
MSVNLDLATSIKTLAARAGYAACGITTAEPFEDYAAAIDERIRRFPEAAALYGEMRHRADPRAKNPWVRSAIVCLRRYGKYDLPPEPIGLIGRSYLADRRFAGCPDHDMPKRMKAGLIELGLRVRTGGVPCRAAAVRAGLARFGRNGFAYSERYGSWVNIEAWLVDADLPADAPATGCPCPEDCDACIRACPTRALEAPFTMRMDRCIAYLTYGAPLPVADDLADRMGCWIYGCDACQDVCPLNRGKWEPLEKAAWLDEVRAHLTAEALAGMDAETYRKLIHPRFWYIPEDDPGRWRANAARAVRLGGGRSSGQAR